MTQTLAHMAFGLYLVIMTAGALFAVFSSSLVRAMTGLIAALLGVAGMYLLLNSPFLAFMQLLIYVGAVCVLIFFALMLADAHLGGDEAAPAPTAKFIKSILAGLIPLLVLTPPLLYNTAPSSENPAAIPLTELGRALMEDYVLPFELISIILLVSMAGGVFLAWDRRRK